MHSGSIASGGFNTVAMQPAGKSGLQYPVMQLNGITV
jgi:hypothetical protein